MTPTQTVIPFKAKTEGVFYQPDDMRAFMQHASKSKTLSFQGIEGEFELLGLASDLTESQWAEVVEPPSVVGYYNYQSDEASVTRFAYPTATESGLSLMRSLGITEGNWLVILKRPVI